MRRVFEICGKLVAAKECESIEQIGREREERRSEFSWQEVE
jgi:hypothetical protein